MDPEVFPIFITYGPEVFHISITVSRSPRLDHRKILNPQRVADVNAYTYTPCKHPTLAGR